MTEEQYDKYFETEGNEFDRVKNKTSNRSDLHAFNLLDRLVPAPTGGDIITAAEHDTIFLSVSPGELAKVATEDEIIELIRCGVRYDAHLDCLVMFV